MGYNTYNHLGAYIEMPEVEKNITKTIRRCSDTKCSNNKKEKLSEDSNFCSKCGKEIEEIDVVSSKLSVVNYYDFAEKYGFDSEVFAQVQDRKILIPNRKFGSIAHWDKNEEIVQEFVWGDSRKAIIEFEKTAKEFLAKYLEVYGISLKVKFGIISYIM